MNWLSSRGRCGWFAVDMWMLHVCVCWCYVDFVVEYTGAGVAFSSMSTRPKPSTIITYVEACSPPLCCRLTMRVSIRSCLWGWFKQSQSKLFPRVWCTKEMLLYDWSQDVLGRPSPLHAVERWPMMAHYSRKIEGHGHPFHRTTRPPRTTLCHTLLRDEVQCKETVNLFQLVVQKRMTQITMGPWQFVRRGESSKQIPPAML